LAFFRDYTEIELDYWDGDTVNLQDDQGNLIHSMSYPGEDSWWDVPYILLENGSYWKDFDGPSPGADVPANWTGPSTGGNCYTVSDEPSTTEYILTGRIVTMTSEASFFDGGVLIQSGKIQSVWSGSTIPAAHAGIQVIETDGTIYPGLIDLHNHMHYNHIPLWDFEVHLSPASRSEEGGYTNRYQWGNNWDYGPSITWMKTNVQSSSRWDMSNEQMKYAEVQAVAGGVTAVQGSPSSGTDAWDSMLSRNVELYNFGQDGMSTCAVCGAYEDDYTGSHLISQNQSGSLNAWFVHLSEGVDASSKAEFDALYEKGLIMDETVVIHGTALDYSQFEKMAEKGAGLVWSPISNLLLYGDTTDVVAADNAGVTISLSPDWGPSGSKSNLHELKTADLWNREILGNHFSDYELAKMVTSNAAEISNWQAFVGQIQSGMYADLVVLDTFHENPYRNLIEAIDRDVRLTLVEGKAVFGDVDLMNALQGDDWEYVNGTGFSKAVDVTSVSVEDGTQSWASIESGLAMAMRNEISDIRENWGEVADLNTDQDVQEYLDSKFDGDYNDGVSHLKNLTLDPIFTMNDARYFDVINRSTHANFHIDMSKLYDYYDVTYDEDSNRPFIEDSNFTPEPVACPTDLCWDGSTRDPADCSCPDQPSPEPSPSQYLKIGLGDYDLQGQDLQPNMTAKATANQLIVYDSVGAEVYRLTIDTSDNRYVCQQCNPVWHWTIESYNQSLMMYTGNTANDGDFTLTPKDTDPGSSTGLADSKSSDSDFLINAGIVVSVIIILVSGAAMVSMMNKSEEDTIGMVKAGSVDQTSSDTVDSPDENGEPKSEESSD
ncbi:MAG: amidohydrolase family protein, partial [Candidatus Thermoplasmatota archaeon]|nr:amidohydrolase family protein [Candidatus Thermoplasmatota archaeon]